MPKRSRGFWLCDYCELTFDHYDEAQVHELQECQNTTTATDSCDRPLQLGSSEQQSLFARAPSMAPLSRTERNLAASSYDPQQQYAEQQRQGRSRTLWERPLLDSDDSSSAYLTADDATACRSLELFLQTTDEAVGLRCTYCKQQQGQGDESSSSTASAAAAAVTPPTIGALGDCVRQFAEHHLISCPAVPSDVRDRLQLAFKKRAQLRAEAGPGWHEEENNLRSLVEFCVAKCRRLGIVNRKPVESGIVMDESAAMVVPATQKVSDLSQLQQQQQQQQQQQWETSSNLSGPFGAAGDALEPVPLEALPPAAEHPTYEMSYPFFQAPNGDWMCKYCSHLPPEYREQHFIWSTPSKGPPTDSFLNHHLSMCREFIRINYPYYQQQGQVAGYSSYTDSSQTAYPQQQPIWETNPPGGSFLSPLAARQPYPTRDSYSRGNHGEPTTGVPYDQQRVYAPRSHRTPQRQQCQQQALAIADIEPLATTSVEGRDDGDTDSATQRSIEHLVETDQSQYDNEGNLVPESSKLVVDEDRLLLTDYFFYLMKQLRLVRFSESDRRTRGGKREKIRVGYGGLQCVHCANASNARKFFWSNVDRLANSFAEIPGHILKCRHCPEQTKNALRQLKESHSDQMARLPRGSQKVFFRRMWRRLHDKDPDTARSSTSPQEQDSATSSEAKHSPPPPLDTKLPAIQDDSPSRTGSEESVVLFERPAPEAAKALSDATLQASPPSPSSRVLLAIPEDKEWLSDTDCFVRRQIEVFCATREEAVTAQMERKFGVSEGQVGIRCIHCAIAGVARQDAVSFPFAISGFYEAVREFHRVHLEVCPNLPPAVKSKLYALNGCSSLSSVLRKYYVLSAQALGLHDTRDGVRAGAKPIPIGSQATFAFSDTSATDDVKHTVPAGIGGETSADMTQGDESSSSSSFRKRKQTEVSPSPFSPDPKRSSPSSNL